MKILQNLPLPHLFLLKQINTEKFVKLLLYKILHELALAHLFFFSTEQGNVSDEQNLEEIQLNFHYEKTHRKVQKVKTIKPKQ